MNKRIFFTIADQKNLVYYERLKKSLVRFHPEAELKLFDDSIVGMINDPHFYYRAKPLIAKLLFKEGYDEVCGLDVDQIITGDLSDIWKNEFDVACVLNDPSFKIGVWDIKPYFNNGLVALKSEMFVDHWLRLCMSDHFDRYQYREQDILNIIASNYFNYKVISLDESDKIYGEFAKPFWSKAIMKDGKIMIEDKQLCVIHFGGGANGAKGNHRIRFIEEVSNYIDEIIK